MKPTPAPDVPGNTPWEKLDSAIRRVLGVSKDEMLKREARARRKRERKRARKSK